MARPSLSSKTRRSEKALLVGIYAGKRDYHRQEMSLDELTRLAESAGATVAGRVLQELRHPQPATFIGSGAAESLGTKTRENGFEVVIFDEDLSPTQNRNLEKIIGSKVLDRTGLILDIFAQRARTREGKLQVELAQLKYLLPRLAGQGAEFSQLAGGIGTRGPGETRLEMDRRKAKDRIALVKRDLVHVRSHRELHRTRRDELPIATVSLVGYTNAGKSTLMNRLTNASVLVEDKLFATLDPTVRRLKLPSGREILLSDTVGFVRKLPHQLVEAFRATFEEVASSTLLLHVIDLSHPHVEEQMGVVDGVLKELELQYKPVLNVFNKADQVHGHLPAFLNDEEIIVSAVTGVGIPLLLTAIERKLTESHRLVSLRLPYKAGAELSLLYRTSRILSRENREDGIYVDAEVDDKRFNLFKPYRT